MNKCLKDFDIPEINNLYRMKKENIEKSKIPKTDIKQYSMLRKPN